MKNSVHVRFIAGMLLLAGIFTLNNRMVASPPAPGTNPPPEPAVVLGTITWTGASSTDWSDPSNWSPMTVPVKGSLAGDDVSIPVVGSGNYPLVTGTAEARSLNIAAGASLSVAVGGTLNVVASATDGLTNAGMLTNDGTLFVDSAYNNGIVNLAGAMIINTGNLTVDKGTGNRMENYGKVINSGTFQISGGLGKGLLNHTGALISNTAGIFQVNFGDNTLLENDGKIDNAATFRVQFCSAGDAVVNRDTVINQAGANFQVGGIKGRLLDNSGVILNSGGMNYYGTSADIPTEAVLNRIGASIYNMTGASMYMGAIGNNKKAMVNNGLLQTAGAMEICCANALGLWNSPTGKVDNQGNMTLRAFGYGNDALLNEDTFLLGPSATLQIPGSGGSGIINNGVFLSTMGCNITIQFTSTNSINNQAGALFVNECATTTSYSSATKIINAGRYTHLKGSWTANGGPLILDNSGFSHLDIPFNFYAFSRYFENSDSLILGSACALNGFSVQRIFLNQPGAYLYSDAQFQLLGMSNFLENYGKAILGPQSEFTGRGLSAGIPVLLNTDTLIMEGKIDMSLFAAYALENRKYVRHSGNFHAFFSDKGVYNNGGAFENFGIMQIDSVRNEPLLTSGAQSFINKPSGKLHFFYSIANGIKNGGGTFTNEGLIEIGKRDSIGLSGIANQANFINNNLIAIGGGSSFGFHGIHNQSGGQLTNNGSISIDGVGKMHGNAIVNDQTFDNALCSSLINVISNNTIVDNSAFSNAGLITENATGNSNIANNTGVVQNLNGGVFNIGSGNPAVTNNDPVELCCSIAVIDFQYSPTYCPDDPGPVLGLASSEADASYQLKDGSGNALGGPIAGTGNALFFGSYPNGAYRVVAEKGANCADSVEVVTNAVPGNCQIQVPNHCNCTQGAYTTVTLKMNAPAGQNWTVKDVIGLYTTDPGHSPLPIGTALQYAGGDMYTLDVSRTSNGFWVKLTNGFTDYDITVGNASW